MSFKSLAIDVDDQPMCCRFSPSSQLLATGLIDGTILLHSFDFSSQGASNAFASVKLLYEISAPEGDDDEDREEEDGASCRAIEFVNGGQWLLCGTASSSLSVYDVESHKLIHQMEEAHEAGISAAFSPLSDSPMVVATGDEDGVIKIFDLRSNSSSQKNKGCVMTYKEHEDFISSFAIHTKEKCLLASSGDGTLSAHDLRTNKAKLRTETDADDEILSLAVVKEGKKVITGTQSGVLNIYSWGAMKDCSDRFPGHPESVDALLKFDEDTVLTGSSDGCIRVVNVLPNKLLGVVGVHSSSEELPIECLSLSNDRRLLASVSHDHIVQLWDLSLLLDDGEEEGDEEEEEEEKQVEEEKPKEKVKEKKAEKVKASRAPAPVSKKASVKSKAATKDSDDDNDDDDEDEEDEEEEGKGKGRKKQKTEKTRWTKSSEKNKTGGGNFFSDII